ncbi:thiolase C-terminal domain-containing protein [Carboxylicivirga sp. N1Y90]|uniref:thiolase C-terminal domain-containing protein n=1 Tax=Carboxylicivirga fragile TaxID=3417571 RepID=UPI003D345FA1|nr:hypothetical protein [Marinilabiliaceae bacterium N1Y90]
MQRRIFLVAGYNTIALGTGRKEFHPKKERPGIEYYMQEAGRATLKKIGGAGNVDESVVGNFMASRFNNQAHLGAFIPSIDKKLQYKPAMRVEGACASGGLAMISGIKSILAGTADVVLAIGVEVQNTVKAMYGADHLALAGYYKNRKNGHAYFFPGEFSDRAGSYSKTYGDDYARKGMATWYANCIQNARLCETAQEHHNDSEHLFDTGMEAPNAELFVDNLNYADCSKVSDGASSIAIVSEKGLKRVGLPLSEAVELVGFSQVEENIMEPPIDECELSTTKNAVSKVLEMAQITKDELATVETHDCFTIAGVLATEAIGFAAKGKGAQFVADGHTSREGSIPFNTTGGLIGWGHPTGATGVHQAVTIWEQLTHQAGRAQISIPEHKPYGLTVNMGGNDKTVVCMVLKKTTG